MGHADAELMQRWQRGESAAFEVLVRRWQQPMARFLVRLVGNTEMVQDLCQEVFLRVYLAGARYRESGGFTTWLYRIALNVARDAGRRQQRLMVTLPDEDEMPATTVHAGTVCERRELSEAVQQALAELPDPLREILVLRHYENINFEQAARLLGVPASTLKSRFAVALNRLRVRLRELGWSQEETHP